MKKKRKYDEVKETKRSARAVLGEALRSRKPGAHKEHRRRIDEEDAEKDIEEGLEDNCE